jgi:hypothetical protein
MLIALVCFSCTGNGGPGSTHNSNAILPSDAALITQPLPQPTPKSSAGAQVSTPAAPLTSTAAAPAKPALPPEDVVIPPSDARYTIFITALDGPDHVVRAKSLREQLKASTQDNKWYIVHAEDKSTIYYGFYRDIDRQSKEGQAAQHDRDYLSSLKTAEGDSPLSLIHFEPVVNVDPPAPAEWDLAKIGLSPQHYWTLQIAAYTADGRAEHPGDVGDRKSAAVESVKALRAEGIPAYFYHGLTISSVCIGTWPESAIKKQSGGDAAGNAATINPNQPLLVTDALPENVKAVRTPDGKPVKVLEPRVEILDQDLLATMKRFPYHSKNGFDYEHTYVDPKTHEKKIVREPSLVMQLPETTVVANPSQPFGADSTQLQIAPGLFDGQASHAPEPGLGKLKSVGQ